jgi:hypothetical protein
MDWPSAGLKIHLAQFSKNRDKTGSVGFAWSVSGAASRSNLLLECRYFVGRELADGSNIVLLPPSHPIDISGYSLIFVFQLTELGSLSPFSLWKSGSEYLTALPVDLEPLETSLTVFLALFDESESARTHPECTQGCSRVAYGFKDFLVVSFE